MFSYIRNTAIGATIFMILMAVAVGFMFKRLASDSLVDLVERNNQALAQGFINSVWKKHRENIDRLGELPLVEWKKYQEFADFTTDAFKHFEEMPVVKLNIYNKKGEIILTTNETDIVFHAGGFFERLAGIGDEKAEGSQRLRNALAGTASNQLYNGSDFEGPDKRPTTGTLIQTLVPIVSDNYVPIIADAQKQQNIEGVIEVFYDITPQWNQLGTFQMLGTLGVILIFIFVIGLLYYFTTKAESIITKQHETNLELAAAAAAAEAESRDKSLFLANVSHELRTPLNAIIGFSEIIKNGADAGTAQMDNVQYGEYIRDIHASGVHLLSLINDILDYSKAEAGKLELDIAEADATKIILNSMRLVSPRAESAEVRLVETVPKEHFVIMTDAKKLKQIMLNLLSNAVKFTPAGGEVRVTAWQNMMDDSITIEVSDTGIGIAPKDISRALAPFGQVDNSLNRKYEGTGLGLPITRKFTEIMGGTFNIQSEIGKGTTITISLPRVAQAKKA